MKKLITALLLFSTILALIVPMDASASETSNTIIARQMDSAVRHNGKLLEFTTFNIDGQNHIRIRDLAILLNRSDSQFDLAWSIAHRAILVTTGRPYTIVGGELTRIQTSRLTGTISNVRVFVDSTEVELSAVYIEGETFFRLRDLSEVLGFTIRWSAQMSSVVVEGGNALRTYSVTPTEGAGTAIRIFDPNRPVIALTFDDGPRAPTSRMLDVLSEHDVRATFFVIGSQVQSGRATVLRAHQSGHEIANHSWSHARLPSVSYERIRQEFVNTNKVIYEVTGVTPKLFRAPFGAIDSRVQDIAESLGMPIINWSLDTLDWQTRNADATFNAIMNNVRNKDIILCHDIHNATVQSMKRVIPALLAQGYQFATVSELMCFSGITPMPGAEYSHAR